MLFAAWRVWSVARRRPVEPARASSIERSRSRLVFLAALFVVYAAVALLPRPMAQLVTTDETVLVIDFHSHTKYSHDGRSGWTEDDVRDWHRGAGYNVAYITDHATYEGAERGVAANPGLAGEGTVLLQGLEAYL